MTMGILVKEKDPSYHLRWNSHLDVSDSFRELRDDSNFLDVSLTCKTKDGKSQSFRAHRIILSAYSNVFKDMLCQHPNTTDPIVYIKGVFYHDLKNIIDFMYNGEISVSKSNLTSFLAAAEELNVKGLNQPTNDFFTEKEDDYASRNTANDQIWKTYNEEKKVLEKDGDELGRCEIELKSEEGTIFPMHIRKFPPRIEHESTKETSINSETRFLNRNGSENIKKENIIRVKDVYKKNKRKVHTPTESDGKTQNVNSSQPTSLDKLIERIDGRIMVHGQKRKLARCKICRKEARIDKIKYHINAIHTNELKSLSK